MNKSIKKILLMFVIALSLVFPLLIKDPYYQHILNISFLFAISTYALNIITGFTGQLNIAHAGFIGVGAYVSALATTNFSLSFWAAMPLAGLVTGLCGFLVGYPSLRVRGIYFALTTLALGELLFIVFDNWISVTGGPMGITGIPAPSPITLSKSISLTFDSKTGFYYLCLAFVFLSIYVNRELLNSRLGRAMLAIRENEDLAQSVGISIAQTKVIAFVLSTIMCGISGSLFAHYFRFISPVSFTLGEMFRILTMLVVGGMGTLSGPLLGTLIFTALPEFLRSVEAYQWIAYGVILMLCVAFMPEGIVGYINKKIGERQQSLFNGERL
ncbi:branched-chain amino acid ABC transporter permease [bacterium]|nr:branched-chain amino acid ABC transporter permease [bacterium]